MKKTPSLCRVNTMYILVQLLYWSMYGAFCGFQTALLLERGFSSGDAGILAALRCLSGILAQPLLGGWADRHPRVPLKWILNVCLGISLVIHVFFYCTRPGFAGMVLIFLALGAFEMNTYPLVDSMAVQFMNTGLPVNYSLGRGLGSFAYAVTCVVLGRQSTLWGVESVLLVHGVLLALLITAVALYPAFPAELLPKVSRGESPHSVWYLLRGNRPFTLMLGAVFLGMTAIMPIVGFMVNIVTDRGGTTTHLGVALFLMAASELPAAILFPYLWRRMGSPRMLLLAVIFMAVKPLLFLLTPSLGWVLAVQPIQMFGYGLFTPAAVYYANESVPAADRVRGQTIMMIASNGLGGMAGNLLGGYAIDLGGVNAMLAVCTLCGAVGVALAAASVRCSGRGDVCTL